MLARRVIQLWARNEGKIRRIPTKTPRSWTFNRGLSEGKMGKASARFFFVKCPTAGSRMPFPLPPFHRGLRTTGPKHNPIFIRIGAVIAGRIARSWVKEQLKGVPRQRRRLYVIGLVAVFTGASGLVGGIYYWVNLVPCPITGRLRFLSTSRSAELEMAKEVSEQQAKTFATKGIKALPSDDPKARRVRRICAKLIKALPSLEAALEEQLGDGILETMQWSVTVVDVGVANAHVLPNGEIYVFTGLLDLCGSDEDGESQLACVIGHEISHALLRHGGERLSKSQVLLATQSALSFVIWGLMPDGFFDFLNFRAIFGFEAVQQTMLNVILSLPNTREQESEADYLGLLLASAACFDPKQAPVLWQKMADKSKAAGQTTPEFLSTHPDSLKRKDNLLEWQHEANKMRKFCNCEEHSHSKQQAFWEGLFSK
mmetsp:Transcript_2664/g.4093  ORF Transcript_2664/g.4093 Transcript_2664/m.4093 type:complete len:428 (+) Transcript_2664:108-1391(+)